MKRNIHMERTYPHPPERVWQVITSAAHMKQWMRMESDFMAEVGHQFALRDVSGNWDGTLYCTILTVNPPHELSYTLKGGAMKHDTVVTFSLLAEGNGTRLTLTHTGFTGLTDVALSGLVGLGWRRMLSQLTDTLKTHLLTQPEGN